MRIWKSIVVLFAVFGLAWGAHGAPKKTSQRRILVVSSYQKDVLWSQETNKGLCAALLKFRYFENSAQAEEFTNKDYIETPRVVIKKMWMDTKRMSNKGEMDDASLLVYRYAKSFKPDLILLGDDEAVEFVGTKFLDSRIPIVFWGVNITPVKYGLVDSVTRPGHNVTGVYQPGFYVECLNLLKAVAPGIKTFATISLETSAGRSHYKGIEYLSRKGALPLKLVATVSTNDFELWKTKVLELRGKVDAFFLVHYSGLQDRQGNLVPPEEVARWYLNNVKIPETVTIRPFVEHGMLCAVDDSGYVQGYQAGVIAHDILEKGAKPETYPPVRPKPGASFVNAQRVRMLGLPPPSVPGVEKYFEKATVLGE
ncbi:MAG: ABC transporter substrate binding protein [bacterium]